MTGKTLLLQAMRGEQTPRPAWVPFVGVHGGHLIGVTAADYLRRADLIVEGLTRARESYKPDGLPLVFDLQLEAEVLGCELRWSDQTPPAVASHPLADRSITELPEFDLSAGRYPVIAEALTRLKDMWADEVALYGLICGPFTLALHLVGPDIFLKMFDTADEVHEILDLCAQIGSKAAAFYIEHGADIVAVVDPMTSQISPEHFNSFVTNPVNRVFKTIADHEALSSFFVCGNATRNLEHMCQTHCDNVSVDENISLEQLADLARQHGKSFGGNLKLTTVLLLGSEDDARADAVRCIDVGGNDGFILAPGCDLPFATPEANLQAVASMVHDEYQREVFKTKARTATAEDFSDIELPDYAHHNRVIIDVVTLDSASCAPCQYMVQAVQAAAERLGQQVDVREHKITTRSGLGHMSKLGVGQIPTICIDGQVKFPSMIPDIRTLIKAIEDTVNSKKTRP